MGDRDSDAGITGGWAEAMYMICQTCGREALPATIERNDGRCEKCKNDGLCIDMVFRDLGRAIYADNHSAVQGIVKHDRAALSRPIRDSWYPIHYAAYLGKVNSLLALIDAGDDIERTDLHECNHTALYVAVESGSFACVDLLLRHGATPHVVEDHYQTTPLHVAARYGFADLVRILLAHGANPACVDHESRTPLALAIECGNESVATILMQHDAARNG